MRFTPRKTAYWAITILVVLTLNGIISNLYPKPSEQQSGDTIYIETNKADLTLSVMGDAR